MTSLRAAFRLLLVLALVAGTASIARESEAAPIVGAVCAVDHAAGGRSAELAPVERQDSVAAAVAAAPTMRAPARWRDLRCGGLPAPRAPDRAPATIAGA